MSIFTQASRFTAQPSNNLSLRNAQNANDEEWKYEYNCSQALLSPQATNGYTVLGMNFLIGDF